MIIADQVLAFLGATRLGRGREAPFFAVVRNLNEVVFKRGAPAQSYHIPHLKTYLFDRHKNFALAHASEIHAGSLPSTGNLLLLVDFHLDYYFKTTRPNISLPLQIETRALRRIARLVAKNRIDETNFTAPFLDNGNLVLQVNLYPHERKRLDTQVRTPFPQLQDPQLKETYAPEEAVGTIADIKYPGKLVVTIDMDHFYIPFAKKGWSWQEISGRISAVVSALAALQQKGHEIGYISVATTSFNFIKQDHTTFDPAAVELATTFLLEEIQRKLFSPATQPSPLP